MSHPAPAANPDELFDVVDHHDQVVGQASRREVHARHWLHRAVHILVHNAEGHFFLQRRSPRKDSFPGCWDASCTGHVDAGEDYATAARRELGEELGWRETSLLLRPVLKLEAVPETGHEFIQIYLLGPLSGPFELNPEEITEGRWIAPDDLDLFMTNHPEQVSGAFRWLWTRHRAELLAQVRG